MHSTKLSIFKPTYEHCRNRGSCLSITSLWLQSNTWFLKVIASQCFKGRWVCTCLICFSTKSSRFRTKSSNYHKQLKVRQLTLPRVDVQQCHQVLPAGFPWALAVMWEQTARGQWCFTLPHFYLPWSYTASRPPRPIMQTWEPSESWVGVNLRTHQLITYTFVWSFFPLNI